MYGFEYHRPGSVADAAAAISNASDGKILAGGQTLLPTMKQRLASPSDLVDLGGIAELVGISVDGATVTIGAMTTHAEVAASADVRGAIPALRDLAGGIGDPQVRNKGTIGGSLANNDPAADYPAAVLALGATIKTNKREIAAEIDRLILTDERGDAVTTLQKVVELLKEAPSIEQKQVTIISDFQRASWSTDSAGGAAQMQQLLRTLSGSAELVLVDVGKAEAGNTAVTSLTAEEPFVVVGRPVHLQVTLRQFGRPALAEQLVKLYVDERLVATRSVTPSADGEMHATFVYTFSTSGEHQVEARIEGDSLATDNRRWLALPVKEDLKVLLVNGRRSGRPADNATFYLEKTFSPSTQVCSMRV